MSFEPYASRILRTQGPAILTDRWNHNEEAKGVFRFVQSGKITIEEGHRLILMSETQRSWLKQEYPKYKALIDKIYRARRTTDARFEILCREMLPQSALIPQHSTIH